MNARQRLFKTSAVLVACLLLHACSKDISELQDFVNNSFKDKKPDIEPLPAIRPFEAFEYVANNEVDPFDLANVRISTGESAAPSGLRPDPNRRHEALEAFPLEQLRFVGTISKQQRPWVIVKTDQGTAHLATVGNYLGKNNGEIQGIVPDEGLIILTETLPDARGNWITREVELYIDDAN